MCQAYSELPSTGRAVTAFYGVQGKWTAPHGATGRLAVISGPPLLCRIDEAVKGQFRRTIRSSSVIMLANCSINNCLPGVLNAEGGEERRHGESNRTYLPVPVPESGLILHESAHAVAKLGEEYVEQRPC